MVELRPLRRSGGTRKHYDRVVATICQECSVGCGLHAYVHDDRIVDVQGDEDHPVSRGRLCAMGTAFVQGIENPDRMVVPAVRKSPRDPFDQVEDWDAALDALADGLRKVRERHGPESLVIGCDTEAGPDFYYGAKRFARLWGTPYVFEPLEEPRASRPSDLNVPNRPCSDWIHSGVLLLVESDPASTHPTAMNWILDARRRGAVIVVADSRFTATMSKADTTLLIRPGSGNRLGMAVMKLLLENDSWQSASIEKGSSEAAAWRESLSELTIETLAEATGLEPSRLVELSRILAARRGVTIITGKRLAYLPHYGVWPTLSSTAGWTGSPGGGWYPFDSGRPEIDVLGDIEEASGKILDWLYGDHHTLATYALEKGLSGELPPLNAVIGSGNCLAGFLAILGKNAPAMELVSYFGSFPNRTCNLSHITFPAVSWAERDTLCFNNDRAVQWAPKIVEPKPGCRSGLEFWIGLAQRFGWEEFFPWTGEDGRADHRAFFNRLLRESPVTSGLTVDVLASPGTPRVHATWPTDGGSPVKAQPPMCPTADGRMVPVEAESPAEAEPEEDERFPLCLEASHVVFRDRDSGSWWPWTKELLNDRLVEINPTTARRLGIENGDEIVVEASEGGMEGTAYLTRMVPERLIGVRQGMGEKRGIVRKKDMPLEEAVQALRESTT
ncbi:MAG: molybdopterin-dependent oxidoreductase [Desulfomonilaceae bacterium]|nr:molybdopterin-dependent oxidoreductase [Desulfomonilaceae bacterium]